MHPRLAEIAAYLEETRAAVVRAVENLSPEDAARRPEADAWSVDEILTHLSLVEPGVAKRIAKSVGLAKGEGLLRETSVESVMRSLDGVALEALRKKQVAPEFVEPKTVLPLSASLAALAVSRDGLRQSPSPGADAPDSAILRGPIECGGSSSVGRASDCGSECRGFDPRLSPQFFQASRVRP